MEQSWRSDESTVRRGTGGDASFCLLRSYQVSLVLASIGGFMEAYTYMTRDGVFANAQTGNIARLGLSLAGGDLWAALRYFVPILTFLAGVSLFLFLKKRLCQPPSRWCQAVLLLEMLLLFLVSLIPLGRLDLLATALVSLVCALQVESFRKFGSNSFSSTMCTGNLRSGAELLNQFFAEGDKEKLSVSLKYFGIDGVFLLGVAVGHWTTRFWSTQAVWLAIFVLGLLFILFTLRQTKDKCSLPC